MFPDAYIRKSFALPTAAILLIFIFAHIPTQSTPTLQGRVVDPASVVIPTVKITMRNGANGARPFIWRFRDTATGALNNAPV